MIPIAHAAAADAAYEFVALINQVILFPLIILLTAVAVLIFLWGGFQYVYKANDPTGRSQGAKHLLWGVIGLLVMVSAYAILTIAANTFDIDVEQSSRGTFSGQPITVPELGATAAPSEPATTDLASPPEVTTTTLPPVLPAELEEQQPIYDDLIINGASPGDSYNIAVSLNEYDTLSPGEQDGLWLGITLQYAYGNMSDEVYEQLQADLGR